MLARPKHTPSILASYAQEESRSASENQKWRIRKMFEQGRPNTGRMLGYRLFDGKLYIIPEEAEIVKRIFTDYLSGMGLNAIMKKLNNMGVPSKNGSKWRENTLHKLLRNEKYTGGMLLQKTYRLDHISKKKMKNRGEKTMYRVENSHEAIICEADFTAVQREIKRRADKYRYNPPKDEPYLFTGMVQCGYCGKNYHRRIANAGSKYAKPAWICETFNMQGKSLCPSQQIPEYILTSKTAEVLGADEFDRDMLLRHISGIYVPAHNMLTYNLRTGKTVTARWQNPSRRESWTDEMKEAARKQQKDILKRRQK